MFNPLIRDYMVLTSQRRLTIYQDQIIQKDGCRYIWMRTVKESGYSDDGITTHYSEYIFIDEMPLLANPSGKAQQKEGTSNSNGIEIDMMVLEMFR
ncbi:hypothetical protein ACEQPO_14195 [Bacillus sp. SL00103]